MNNIIPPEWIQAGWGVILTFIGACLGRLMYHIKLVQRGQRTFFSLHLIWEVPTALAIGFVADGVGAHYGLEGRPLMALVIFISYLGPAGIECIIAKATDHYFKLNNKK